MNTEFTEKEAAKWGRVDFSNPRHRYILSLCYQLGWVRMHPRLGRMVVDNVILGNWLKRYGKYKKPILEHNDQEIGAVIKALEVLLTNWMK